ncbi:hypothetical protein [Microbacterium sp. TPD7012]|uniref:hypothetical protein n=1 Tax=Microbacterium sp. TPD7012 TaxID=2171975 RepID=UPI0010571F29|nr:hypothetical protein [Microbacterium sp. TPD7012]
MNHHRHVLTPVIALALLSTLVVGCSPSPTPTPTPTAAFATEEEAFAAAEETYRAYVDATNSTDLAVPATFEPVFEWLQDDAAAAARENYSEFHAKGLTRTGRSTFDTFTPESFAGRTVVARLCLDVSEVEIFDSSGESVVPDDRPPRQPLEAEFTAAATETGLAIVSMIPAEGFEC